MPALATPTGTLILGLFPGSTPSIGVGYTAAEIDLDITDNASASIAYMAETHAQTVIDASGLDHTNLTAAQKVFADKAMLMIAAYEYARIRRNGLALSGDCEPEERWMEKERMMCQIICDNWKEIDVTDKKYCSWLTGHMGEFNLEYIDLCK